MSIKQIRNSFGDVVCDYTPIKGILWDNYKQNIDDEDYFKEFVDKSSTEIQALITKANQKIKGHIEQEILDEVITKANQEQLEELRSKVEKVIGDLYGLPTQTELWYDEEGVEVDFVERDKVRDLLDYLSKEER